MNRSVRSVNNNQNKSLEHVIIFGRSSRICFNFKTNHTATKQSCPQFPSLISAHLRQKQALGDCLRRVCLFCIYIFSYSVTFRYWLPFKVFWALYLSCIWQGIEWVGRIQVRSVRVTLLQVEGADNTTVDNSLRNNHAFRHLCTTLLQPCVAKQVLLKNIFV